MHWLESLSNLATRFVSSSWGMLSALLVLAYWLVFGPMVGWGNAWFYFDAIASAAAFFLLFLLQRSQTKDSMALHLKVNELLAALHKASPRLINIEDLSEAEIVRLHDSFEKLQSQDRSSHSIEDISAAEDQISAADRLPRQPH